jgi:hypothetical protein
MTARRYCLLLGSSLLMLNVGCAHTWDVLTSQRFRDAPLTSVQRLLRPEDPVAILLADPPRSGDEQADAWRRLSAERYQQCSPEQQVRLWHMLETTATQEHSPVLRMAAIHTLGRLGDPRAVAVLIAAYQRADGYTDEEKLLSAPPVERITTTGASAGRWPTQAADAWPLQGPRGYPPEWTVALRCRALEALGELHTPEAVQFLATVAGVDPQTSLPGSGDREIQLAAIRALSRCRHSDAVIALTRLLRRYEQSVDPALVHRTHEGLVRLTGQRLPADPNRWEEVVQAGVVLAPEPAWWQELSERVVQAVHRFR